MVLCCEDEVHEQNHHKGENNSCHKYLNGKGVGEVRAILKNGIGVIAPMEGNLSEHKVLYSRNEYVRSGIVLSEGVGDGYEKDKKCSLPMHCTEQMIARMRLSSTSRSAYTGGLCFWSRSRSQLAMIINKVAELSISKRCLSPTLVMVEERERGSLRRSAKVTPPACAPLLPLHNLAIIFLIFEDSPRAGLVCQKIHLIHPVYIRYPSLTCQPLKLSRTESHEFQLRMAQSISC